MESTEQTPNNASGAVEAAEAVLREEGDGASTTSSSASEDFDNFDKLQAEMIWGGEDREELLNADTFPWHQQDEKLLEELFRLKLTSVNPSAPFGNAPSVSGASLPPKQRIKLYQPRTKLEQFEDILMESQLLEANLPEHEVAALAEAAGLTGGDLDFDLMEGFDFEASDAIFNEESDVVDAFKVEADAQVPVQDTETGMPDQTVTASSSPSNSSSLASSNCDCASCRERHSIEAKESDELERLRKCWLEVREDVKRVYRLVLCNAWNDPNRFEERPDLNSVKEKVHKLVWRDAHQLFRRLEAAVREFVFEIKLKLTDLLQKQAKNPFLARDFIQYLLEGYEKVCSAAQHIAPALMDLEVEHLRRFSLTWEVLNKHLYQSIIYSDSLFENNLPIFLSQLRSLFPDKEHEARYTELVRGYLDFDVEMVNIGAFWKTSETMIEEYNSKQNLLRAKQQTLKEDWERFKAQRKDLEKQIRAKKELQQDPPSASIERCECDVCLTPGIPPLNLNLNPSEECSALTAAATCLEKMPNLVKLYPHLMATIKQNSASTSHSSATSQSTSNLATATTTGASNYFKDNESLAALFPSLLTVDGPKLPTSASVAAELSQALSTALSLTDTMPQASCLSDSLARTAAIHPSTDDFLQQKQQSFNDCSDKLLSSAYSSDNNSVKSSSAAKKSNAEISKLLQQHYCSHKSKKKHPAPSASSIRKGKVPLPSSCVVEEEDSSDELSEDSSSLPPDDTCSSASSMTSQMGHVSNNGKPCSCCYCEVFGHGTGNTGAQTVAPVSRNYPEMRERLRLLLSKKKKEETKCKQPHHHHHQQQHEHQQLQQPACTSSGSSSTTSSTSSVKSTTPSGHVVKKDLSTINNSLQPSIMPATIVATKATPPPCTSSMTATTPQPAIPSSKSILKPELAQLSAAKAVIANAQARSQSASSLAPKATPPPQRIEKSSSAVAPKASGEGLNKPSEKDLELLLEFIEGSAASANEKKKAKKERQKQQKMEEIRAREIEERHRREAEEAERHRREEEERQRLETERQMAKKAKKKAAQRAKKATAVNGLSFDEADTEDDLLPVIPPEKGITITQIPAPKVGLDDLRARQMRELQELQARHLQQMEDEQKKLLETTAASAKQLPNANNSQSKKWSKKAAKNAAKGSVMPSTKGSTPAPEAAKAGAGTQIKITRTASGGVEFATIPADVAPPSTSAPKKTVESPFKPQVTFGPMPPTQPYFTSPSPSTQQQSFIQQPSPDRPCVPSLVSPSQPMVTIRRVENPEICEPTVTISAQSPKDNSKKLLYTLINGQVHRAKDAPDDLIPDAKPLPADFTKRFTIPSSPSQTSRPTASPSAQRDSLPTDPNGRLDLDRLHLPPGISITKIQGNAPERKYFPAKPEPEKLRELPPPHFPAKAMTEPPSSGLGYSAMAGLPVGLNGPNVIVVETSSLKTREEERKELELKKKNNKNKKKSKKELLVEPGLATSPMQLSQNNLGAYPYLAPQIPEQDGGSNNLKCGPQVLIKNINGSVVITQVPESKKTSAGFPVPINGNSPKPKESPAEVSITGNNSCSNAKMQRTISIIGENIDEINSVFAPKDIDLDNVDEDEREIEAFKRFCFDSVPLQQKTKVNFDVRSIFKKK